MNLTRWLALHWFGFRNMKKCSFGPLKRGSSASILLRKRAIDKGLHLLGKTVTWKQE